MRINEVLTHGSKILSDKFIPNSTSDLYNNTISQKNYNIGNQVLKRDKTNLKYTKIHSY